MRFLLLLGLVVILIGSAHPKTCTDDDEATDKFKTSARHRGKGKKKVPATKKQDTTKGGCEANWKQIGDSCYRVFTQPKPWGIAKSHCAKQGAHLVSIEDKKENSQVIKLARGYKKKVPAWMRSVYFWTAGNDIDDEGKFVWYNTKAPLTYTNWRPGEPNNFLSNEDCLGLWVDKSGRSWNDVSCRSYQPYICEKEIDE